MHAPAHRASTAQRRVSPSLLRVFARTGSHHPDSDYTVDRLPTTGDELALFCWPDSTLRELALLALDALPPVPQHLHHATRISLRLVYYDPDSTRFRSTDLANFTLREIATPPSSSSTSSAATTPARLDRTLAEAKYVVGDLVDLALLVPAAEPTALAPTAALGPAGAPAFGIRGAAAAHGPRGGAGPGAHGPAPGGRGSFAPLVGAGGPPHGRGGPGGFGPRAGAGPGPGGAGYGPRGGAGGPGGGAPVHPARAGMLAGGAGGPRRGGAPGAADHGWGAEGGRRRSDGPDGFGGGPRGAAGPYGGGGGRGPGGYDSRDGPRDRPPHVASSSTANGPPPPRRRSSRSRSPGARRASPPPPRRRPVDDDVRMRD
ncbi:hypothetical protein JCM3775_003194 [Rhodotorula graminis]